MTADAVALEHYRSRGRLVDAAAAAARRTWAQVDLTDLDGSWAATADRLTVTVAGAQLAAASAADTYLGQVLAQQGVDGATAGRVAVDRLAGIASDGRPLASLLRQSVVATKVAIAGGAAPERALASGYATLNIVATTQVADAGRVADHIAMVARRQVTVYVRMLVGKSCSRCAVLAGKRFRWNQGFKRHPRCDCIHIPGREDTLGDPRTDPKRYFASLSTADQDRIFTKAGAESIRSGADIGQVVNARRGMTEAGTTTESTTRHGVAQKGRLMPEEIFRRADGDREAAISQLRLHGYII